MRAVVFLASLVIAGPSLAQSLLVELRDADMFCFDCPPDNITITLDGSFSTGGPVRWAQPVTTNDIGATFTMPSDLLDDFARLTGGDTGLLLEMQIHGAGVGGIVRSNDLTYGTLLNNPEVIRHAPNLGRNLTGYTISSITHTLNSLTVDRVASNHYNLSGSSTPSYLRCRRAGAVHHASGFDIGYSPATAAPLPAILRSMPRPFLTA